MAWCSLIAVILVGTLPTSLCNYVSLKLLLVTSNNLVSTVPTCLQLLTALTILSIRDNSFTGESLVGTQINKMQRNNLPLRSSLVCCVAIVSYVGPFPIFVTSLTNLNFLGLGGNPYNPSTLSPQLGYLTRLTSFLLFGAQLFGTIPSELSVLNNVQIFRVDDNKLIGNFHVLVTWL